MMSFHEGYKVKFLLHSFASDDTHKGIYFLGLLFTFVLSFLVISARKLKIFILKTKRPKWLIVLVELAMKFGAGLEMLLLMTFNYGVVGTIIVGSSIGYIWSLWYFMEAWKCSELCKARNKMMSTSEDNDLKASLNEP